MTGSCCARSETGRRCVLPADGHQVHAAGVERWQLGVPTEPRLRAEDFLRRHTSPFAVEG